MNTNHHHDSPHLQGRLARRGGATVTTMPDSPQRGLAEVGARDPQDGPAPEQSEAIRAIVLANSPYLLRGLCLQNGPARERNRRPRRHQLVLPLPLQNPANRLTKNGDARIADCRGQEDVSSSAERERNLPMRGARRPGRAAGLAARRPGSRPASSGPTRRRCCLAVGETVVLLHPPLPVVGVSIVINKGASSK